MKKLVWFLLFLIFIYLGYRYYHNNQSLFLKGKPPETSTQTGKVSNYMLYFNNSIKNPNLLDCTHVYAVDRQTKEMITPEFVIKDLIKGLTKEETKLGFVTAIPKECELNFVTVQNGKAIVDFKPFHIAGSCATGMFTSQVKQTMLALANINEVLITIQGKSGDEILQP
jgi:spore germination protein GerM